MKLITVFTVVACRLMVTPNAAAYELPNIEFSAATCGSILSMGVVPYTLCMAAYAAGVASGAVVLACEVIFGPGNC